MNTAYLLSFTKYLDDMLPGVFATNEAELKQIVLNYWETYYFGTEVKEILVLLDKGELHIHDEDYDTLVLYIHELEKVTA